MCIHIYIYIHMSTPVVVRLEVPGVDQVEAVALHLPEPLLLPEEIIYIYIYIERERYVYIYIYIYISIVKYSIVE